MKRSGLLAAMALALVATACGSRSVAQSDAVAPVTVPLTIKSGAKSHAFKVELARTNEEQAKGLMFRESLAPDRGMIFPMIPVREASFWMKNTVIPLDIIFVRADGSIARIESNTVPYSLEPVSSLEPVAAVLEIAGGRSEELGLKEGDTVIWDDPSS